MKLTKFEAEELRWSIGVLLDSGADMLESIKRTEAELEALDHKITSTAEMDFQQWELSLLKDEAQNMLEAADFNSDSTPEYKANARKLKTLITKLSQG